jgi:ribosomal protein S18 acetylase RimI-like enzyme
VSVAAPERLSLPRDLTAQGVTLRPATEADLVFLRALYGAGRALEMAWVGWPPAVAARFLDDQFRLRQHHYATHHAWADDMIVAADEAPVGRLVLDRSAPAWRLVDIALVESVQRRGWGSALLRGLQQAARAERAKAIELHVAFDNPRAEALYRRLGFGETFDRDGSATHRRLRWPVS